MSNGLRQALDHSRSKPTLAGSRSSRGGVKPSHRVNPSNYNSSSRSKPTESARIGAGQSARSRARQSARIAAGQRARVGAGQSARKATANNTDNSYASESTHAFKSDAVATEVALSERLKRLEIQYGEFLTPVQRVQLEADRYFILQETFADVVQKDKVCFVLPSPPAPFVTDLSAVDFWSSAPASEERLREVYGNHPSPFQQHCYKLDNAERRGAAAENSKIGGRN